MREMALGNPSQHWQRINAQTRRDLDLFGPEQIKRHQALRYFTWRWSWASIRHSEQMRFLLAHTSPRTWLRCAAAPMILSDETWQGVPWPRRDRWLYSFAVRLLWEFARGQDSLDILNLPEPLLGSPLPVYWRQRLISQDLANSALEVEAMSRALSGQSPRSILEIGAGYGRTAYVLLHLLPTATCTVVDIEPALDIARWYLSQLFPAERLRFLTPGEALELPPASVDLAYSISSLQEMTPEQVEGYLKMFDRLASGGSVYLKQWAEWWNPDDRVTLRFDDYPVPARWELAFKESAPVQTSFRQAAWLVPPY